MRRNIAKKTLDTATSLVAELGFENVTIKQLAQAANSNPAAISYYFGGKENLYQEVLKYQFSPALQALQEVAASYRLTATEQLLAYVEVVTAVQHKQPFLALLWQCELNDHAFIPNRCIIKKYTIQLYHRIVFALEHGISQNEFIPDLDLYSTAFVLLEMMHAPSVPVWLLIEPGLTGPDARTNYILQAVRHYLQGISGSVAEGTHKTEN